jgi:predicted O-linked N-acetylglucosamine transferase (SPINDLY family)
MNSNLFGLKEELQSTNINYAIQLHQEDRLDEAEALYRQILQEQPENSDALHLLGVIAYQRKQYQDAKALVVRAISFHKRVPYYPNTLGNIYLAQGLLDKAEECYIKAIKLDPQYADARNNLGNIHRERGKLQEAINAYQHALRIDPKRAEIHNNLGTALEMLRRFGEAVDHYREAIRLRPDFADGYANLAGIYKAEGKLIDAIAVCQKALSLKPGDLKTLLHMGNAYSQLGQIDRGIECFRQALRSKPDFCEVHTNLGHALREQGNNEGASIHFRKAVSLNPASLFARLGNCIGQIPLFQSSIEEVVVTRENYRRELESLSRDIDLSNRHTLNQAASIVGNCQPFFLAYQGENDRELQSLYGNLMVRIQSTCFPEWSKKRPMPPYKRGEPLRIGIVSGFYWLHSNWKIPIKGWIENLNRRDFQLFGYYTDKKSDSQTEIARRSFDQFREGLYSTEQWCEQITGDRLHVLIFPEVGMDSATVRLASLRLAPIQCTSWGHPDTSGLPTIDYYLSSELMEPENADEHYTEKLIRLPNLSIYYEPLSIPSAAANRGSFGLDKDKTLFICTQSLFKYLPQYDEVFPRIAKEIPQCQFAFLNYYKSSRLGERFIRRFEKSFTRFGLRCTDYVKLLPHLNVGQYRALNLMADVFLDSIGWSGCNSTLEALTCNLPIVTMPGKLMRGRHTHAILKMMGLDEVEGKDLDEYVAIAGRLGKEVEWRKHISEKISKLKHRVYRDTACIRGLEEFLKQAVESSC